MSTNTWSFREFVWEAFGVPIDPPWITRFCSCQNLSLKIPAKSKGTEIGDDAIEEAIKFLEKVHQLNFKPKDIIAIDKTSLRSTLENVHHISPKGR